MTKEKRVNASSTEEISVRSKKCEKGKMDYHTTYRNVSAKNRTRTVNVKGESIVKGGKCITEKMSPRPRTVTIPPSKTCTTGTISKPLRVSLVEDNTGAGVLRKRTVDKKVVGGVAEGAAAVWAVASQVGKTSAVRAIISDTAILWVAGSPLATARAFVLRTVDTEVACGVALKTTSLCSRNGFWAQAGIARRNSCWKRGRTSLKEGRSSVSGNVRRDIKQRGSGRLRRRGGFF